MISKPAVAWIAMACLSLSACGDGRPKGQVVAKVGKEEVTIIDLNAALAGAQTPNAAARKAAEQQALASILQRKSLAQAARKQKLDRTPEFARQERQLEENLLFRTWEDKLVKSIPAPNADEIQQFIDQHPDLYKAHKVFTIDVVRFAAPLDPALAEALRPLTTLDQARTLLTERKIAFANAASKVDALSVDPRFVDQLIKMKTNEIFVMPQASGQIILGHVTDLAVQPVPNDLAVRHATDYLRRTRAQDAIQRQFGPVVAQGMKNVTYAKGYELPKSPAPSPAASPTAPAKAK